MTKLDWSETLAKYLTPPKLDYYAGLKRDSILLEDNMSLYYYRPLTNIKTTAISSILIIYAVVSRPSILDISAQRSFIQALLKQGLAVYLLDFSPAHNEVPALDQNSYILELIPRAINTLQRHSKNHFINNDKVNILGICQGGYFSICYASLFPQQINKLITLVTPVDFHIPTHFFPGFIQHLEIKQLLLKSKWLPNGMLNLFFTLLKPYENLIGKMSILNKSNENSEQLADFLAVERWLYDTPLISTCLVYDFLQTAYRDNQLVKNQLKIGEQQVNLANMSMPILNIYAKHDHIVPAASSRALKNFISAQNYQEFCFAGGHIGLLISTRALAVIPKMIQEWLIA